jgi:hypothetical protein
MIRWVDLRYYITTMVELKETIEETVSAGSGSSPTLSRDVGQDALSAYGFSNNVLRAWLGTYSIGVPALLFSGEGLRSKLAASGHANCVALCFALAIACQVALTFFNKYTQWGVYAKSSDPPLINAFTAWCERASEWILIDLFVDLATICLLAVGTVTAYRSIFPS